MLSFKADLIEEDLFRVILSILFLTFFFIRGYYTRKGQVSNKGFLQKRIGRGISQEGKLNFFLQDAAASIWGVILLLYVFYPPWALWSTFPLPAWIRWLGVGLGAASNVLLVWVHRVLGEYWSYILELKMNHTLITHGPYRWVRHPMYSASLGFMAATALISANWVVMLVCLLTVTVILKRITIEEEMMIAGFGEEYRTYMRHTGRLLPWFMCICRVGMR